LIVKIENSENFIHLFDDVRTPTVALKSVEAQQRYDYGFTEILVPKATARLVVTSSIVYLSDKPEMYQLDHNEIGYGNQSELIRDLKNILNDVTGSPIYNIEEQVETLDNTEMLLNNIYDELRQIKDVLKDIRE
jgi:hypothetical protein